MLVLSRKTGQSIIVGGEITVTVVSVGRGRVQLGVTAPVEVEIHREELLRRIRREEAAVHDTLEPVTAG